MQSIWELNGERLRSQTIEVATCEYDERRILVEASFRDRRYQDTYVVNGGRVPAGPVHDITIRLLIDSASRMIEDAGVKMDAIPFEACRETIDGLAAIKGLTITRGFTAKVKSLVGGRRGCTHLVELLQATAPAIVLGLNTYGGRKPSDPTPEWRKKTLNLLVNSCHAWDEDGPLVQGLKEEFGHSIAG